MNDARQAVDLTLVEIQLDTHFIHNFPFCRILLQNLCFDEVTVAGLRDVFLCLVNQAENILAVKSVANGAHRYQDTREHSSSPRSTRVLPIIVQNPECYFIIVQINIATHRFIIDSLNLIRKL